MYVLGLIQVPEQVVMTLLHSKRQQHSSYSRVRKPIRILLLFLRDRFSIYYQKLRYFHQRICKNLY